MIYARIDLATLTVQSTGSLPIEVDGLSDRDLSDLSWVLEKSFGHDGKGYWPLEISDPLFDPATQALTDELTNFVPVNTRKVVKAKRGVRALSAAEVAARAPKPTTLSKLQFIGLMQQAGGLTDARLVAARTDPALGALWIKFEMSMPEITVDHPVTKGGLDALVATGYLTAAAKAAVLAAWPVA